MDHFFRRLMACALLAVAAMGGVAHATCEQLDAAFAQCQSSAQSQVGPPSYLFVSGHCEKRAAPGVGQVEVWQLLDRNPAFGGGTDESSQGQYACVVPPPSNNPCSGMSARPFNAQFKMVNGETSCPPVPQPDGSSVKCGMVFTATGQPVQNAWGNWSTQGTLTPTGNLCGSGGLGGADWETSDGSPLPNPPPPAGPPKPADIAPPKLCGGVSCYDPKTGQYCATGDSGQVCTAGPPPGQSGGNCASGGDTTVCAGSPQAPKPPVATVPDPPTQTKGTDQYTGANPATGQLQNITVGTYNTGAGSVSSGAGASDVKPPAPASSSSVGKPDGTGASGGGDCNNPPSVSGSPALGMVATQAWQTRCAVDRGLNGTAEAGDVTTPSGQSAWVDTPLSGDSVADNANKGVYDFTGMGFSVACPLHVLTVSLWSGKEITVHFESLCDPLGWLKAIVIGFAIFWAAKITVGGTG